MRKIVSATAIMMCSFGSTAVYADLLGNSLGDFKINAFLSAGVAWTNVDFLTEGSLAGIDPIYVSRIQKDPSFDKDSNVGLQFTKYLRDDVNITVQLYAEGFYNFEVEATWAFIEWEPNDTWQFRAGRVRTNPYMLSDYINVAFAYPWVRPPQEVYSQIPISNFSGFDAKYHTTFCDRDFSISGFWGSTTNIMTFPVGPFFALTDFVNAELRHLISFNAKYGNEVFSIRAGYEKTLITLYPDSGTFMQGLNSFVNTMIQFGLLGEDYVNYFSADHAKASFMGLGYQFDWNNIVSMGELVRRRTNTPIISNPIGWYLMGGYRVKNIMPHITYGRERIADNSVRRFNSAVNAFAAFPPPAGFGVPLDAIAQQLIGTSYYYNGGAGNQTSVTLGVRWDVIDGVCLKAEYCHVHPDNLTPGLFDFNPLKSVNVYSFAVNAVT
jgi:hypothetical protein